MSIIRKRALRAMTIDAAWQNHLDTDRELLEAGKLPDTIVLSGDPLQVDDVRKLHVQRVWIGGRDVYRRNPDSSVGSTIPDRSPCRPVEG